MGRKRRRKDAAPVVNDGPEPRPAGVRDNDQPYHRDDADPLWIEPSVSARPSLQHQCQSLRVAIEKMTHDYRAMVLAGQLGFSDAEFRLRGLHDAYRTLKWVEKHEAAIKAVAAKQEKEAA